MDILNIVFAVGPMAREANQFLTWCLIVNPMPKTQIEDHLFSFWSLTSSTQRFTYKS